MWKGSCLLLSSLNNESREWRYFLQAWVTFLQTPLAHLSQIALCLPAYSRSSNFLASQEPAKKTSTHPILEMGKQRLRGSVIYLKCSISKQRSQQEIRVCLTPQSIFSSPDNTEPRKLVSPPRWWSPEILEADHGPHHLMVTPVLLAGKSEQDRQPTIYMHQILFFLKTKLN